VSITAEWSDPPTLEQLAPSPTAPADTPRSRCSSWDTEVLTVEFKFNLLAPAAGDHIEAVGTVIKAGRTLTQWHNSRVIAHDTGADRAFSAAVGPDGCTWEPQECTDNW
jgi:hypothetical protein